jgi:hypothetical protein
VLADYLERKKEELDGWIAEAKGWGDDELLAQLQNTYGMLGISAARAKEIVINKAAAKRELAEGDTVSIKIDKRGEYDVLVDDPSHLDTDLTVAAIVDDGKAVVLKTASGRVKVKKTHLQ